MSEEKIKPREMTKAEAYIFDLTCLLHYHERVMFSHQQCPAQGCECEQTKYEILEGKCPNAYFIDKYAETLREAIRCIQIVHKDELPIE